jgi:hypothetical protein
MFAAVYMYWSWLCLLNNINLLSSWSKILFETLIEDSWSGDFLLFMEPEGPLPYSQELLTGPSPKQPDDVTHIPKPYF